MNGLDRLLLLKASQAANTVETQTNENNPVDVTDPGVTNLPAKKKNVKADATSGNIEVALPSSGMELYDTVTVTKIDDTVNTITVSNLAGADKVLVYQYQSVVASYDGAAWQLIDQVLPPTEDKPEIHKSLTAPTDLEMLWYDLN